MDEDDHQARRKAGGPIRDLLGQAKAWSQGDLKLPLEGTGEPGDIDMSENAPCRCIDEFVKLDGDDAAISEEELERFIASFPIEAAGSERAEARRRTN